MKDDRAKAWLTLKDRLESGPPVIMPLTVDFADIHLFDRFRQRLDSATRVPLYALEPGPALTATEMEMRLSPSFTLTIPTTDAIDQVFEAWRLACLKTALNRRPARGWCRHVRNQKANRRAQAKA